jgi:hypothetical protein
VADLNFDATAFPVPVCPELPCRYSQHTREERALAREEYVRRQRGICPFCLQPLLGDPPPVIQRLPVSSVLWPPEFFRWPIHLHHDHKTDLTIGAYHARCNAVLAAYFQE